MILTALVLPVLAVQAQSQRLVLAEEFTQASCGPCASQNPAFNTLLSNNDTKVVSVKYQTNWPGSDPMNVQTQTWVGPRVTYYNVSGVPHALLDGVPQSGGSYLGAPSNWTQAKIDTRYATTSPFTVEVSHTLDASMTNATVDITITATAAVTGNLVLQCAMVEKEVTFCAAPGSNGEKDFYSVMRKMLPSATGTALASSWTVGQTQTITLTTPVPSYIYDLKQLAFVAFIQDNSTLEVHQSGISEPLPVALDADIRLCGSPSITCGSSITPSFDLTNDGTTTLTAVDFTYSINAGSPSTQSWTGSLAPGASTAITFPTMPVNAGTNTFTASITSVNGASDLVSTNNTYTAIVNSLQAAAVAAPVVEGFTNTAFPPTSWTKINGGANYSYTRSALGATANNGSVKMDFWSSPAGDEELLITPKIDLTSFSPVHLNFMMAKAGYSAAYADRLIIEASSDCGANWTSVYNKVDPALSTAGNVSTAYTPTSGSAAWRAETADLTAFSGQAEVLIRFRAVSGNGNNMFLDDINITNSAVGINENEVTKSVSLFPVPSKGFVFINTGLLTAPVLHISITDMTGKTLVDTQMDNKGHELKLDLNNYENGTYLVNIEGGSYSLIRKVVLEK